MANSRTTTLFKTFLILFLCAATLQNANAQSASAKTRISAQTDIASILLSPDTGTKSAAASALLAKASRPDASLRARLVNMDFPALNRTYARITAEAAPQTIQIPFFDDAIFVVQINRTEPTSSGGIAYIGNVPDDPQSIVVLVINDGAVSINLAARGQRYEIHGSAESGFVARQKSAIDRPDHPPTKLDLTGPKFFEVPSATTTKGSPQAGAKASLTTTPLAAATLADDGSIIDVMVVYTPAARLSQTPGTAAQMNANIDAQIALTNQVYANSLVVQRLRLVYKGEVNYNEINMDVDLPRLEITNDGFMDEVHILRDLYAADLVSLWGVYTDYCGLGSLMSTEAASFASAGFNVVASPACTGAGGYTFAHELGHNMGLRHDNFVDTTANTTVTPAGSTTPTTITYAHGYIDLTNRFRTVMSYNDQCVATIGSAPPTFGCTRIPYFSNPAVSYNNNPPYLSAMPATTGNATNAHEQRALNDTRETVANFRLGLTTFTGPGIVAFIPANYSVSEGAGSVTLSVARHVGSTGAITVNYASVNGTATAGADYTAVSNTLSWANGDTSVKTITIPILQDAILEGTEKFTVVLSGATGGASVGSAGGVTATATVSIIDDEADNFPPGGVVPATYVTPASGTGGAWTVETTDGYLSPTSLRSAQTLSAALSTTNFVNSDLEFTGDFAAGNLSFAYMLSSYPTYQQFEFFIDNGVVVSNTGGESGWVPVTQAISAGTHILRWRFKSGLSFNCANAIPAAPGGANCKNRVFIDAVSLPLTLPTLGILKNGTGTGTVTGTGINCGADCVETTTAGASFTLTATPAIDSSFAGWSGGGCSGTGTCTVMLAASLNVTATFNILPEAFPANCALPVGWTVPAAAYGGWTVAMDRKRSGACSLKSTPMPNAPAPGAANANKSQIQVSGNYGAGNVSFYYNVSSEADYDCLRFFVDTVARAEMGNCNGAGGFGASGDITDWTTPVSIPVAAGAHTFLWSYEKDESGFNGSDAAWIDDVTLPPAVPVTLTTAKAGNGAGTITGTGINCGIGCTVNVAPGTVVALTATASPGSTFSGWSGGCSGTGACNVTVNIATTVNATFTLQQFNLTVTPAGAGTGTVTSVPAGIGCGATCTFVYNFGQVVTLTPSPAQGSAFGGWSGSGCSGTGTCVITIAGLATVTATFNISLSVPDAPTIGTAVAGNGQAMLTFTPPAFNGGSSITSYTATCNPNTFTGSSTFSPVSVPNLVNGTLYTCSVQAVNSVGPSVASATATVTPSPGASPALVNVFSRKSHSGVPYDVTIQTGIAITGLISVEPRAIGSGHTVYFRFGNTITNPGNVVVVDGSGASVTATPVAAGNDVIVTIPSLTDNKRITISLSNAAGPSGTAATQSVSMGFLVGDFNSSRSVNASDISAVKAQSGLTLSQANFKFDVNTAGGITSSDVSAVKARAGLVLP